MELCGIMMVPEWLLPAIITAAVLGGAIWWKNAKSKAKQEHTARQNEHAQLIGAAPAALLFFLL